MTTDIIESSMVIFCDFDGTITRRDVGDALFQTFGIFEPYHTFLLEGKISVAEYYRTATSATSYDFNEMSVRIFAEQMEMDAYFPAFYEYCRLQNFPLTIVSDGFHEYIQPILKANGIIDADVRANFLSFQETGSEPIFPAESENCLCFCASCKRNVMLSTSPIEALFVYIGDGLSDTCVASHADIIFAKGALAAFCNEHRIPHYTFHTFFDILHITKKLVGSNKIKHRRQAELLRKKSTENE